MFCNLFKNKYFPFSKDFTYIGLCVNVWSKFTNTVLLCSVVSSHNVTHNIPYFSVDLSYSCHRHEKFRNKSQINDCYLTFVQYVLTVDQRSESKFSAVKS